MDLNFRKKLWTSDKAQSIMRPLMKYVDVCIGNEEDAELCLGFKIVNAARGRWLLLRQVLLPRRPTSY